VTRSWRLGLLALGLAGMLAWFVLAYARIPPADQMHSPYGEAVNARVVAQRHVTDAVSAVNFDYRGFDTLGEEFILFVSVIGALVILREAHGDQRGAQQDAMAPSRAIAASAALRAWLLIMTGPTVLYGIYMVAHGQSTPGGGFQGGVILATAPLLVFLAEDYDVFKRVASHRGVEVAEAIGAGAYALIGLSPLFFGKEFLTNILPLGKPGSIASGGTILAINYATGLEVAAGFVLLLYGFLQKALQAREE
jgi:multicomponent Na+:H+ antiporter subunit B